MTQPGTYAGQRATGRPVIRSVNGFGNFMAWTGTSSGGAASGWINLNFQPSGYSFNGNWLTTDSSNYGPALVLNPMMTGAGLFWTDAASSGVFYTLAAPSTPGSSSWTITPGSTAIPGAAATGGPAAFLGLLDGEPVVTVVWQDKVLNSMAFWQSDIFGGASGDTPVSLGVSCTDSPTLILAGGKSYLAYFDTNKAFNLAVDPNGGANFNLAGRFTTSTITSSYAPALVTLNNQLAYVVWATGSGVSYQQIGVNAQGSWVVNNAAGCSGSITGITPSAGPTANVIEVVVDGVITSQILIGWAQSGTSPANMIYTTTILPVFTPPFTDEVPNAATQ